jgi:hypothetical protein
MLNILKLLQDPQKMLDGNVLNVDLIVTFQLKMNVSNVKLLSLRMSSISYHLKDELHKLEGNVNVAMIKTSHPKLNVLNVKYLDLKMLYISNQSLQLLMLIVDLVEEMVVGVVTPTIIMLLVNHLQMPNGDLLICLHKIMISKNQRKENLNQKDGNVPNAVLIVISLKKKNVLNVRLLNLMM